MNPTKIPVTWPQFVEAVTGLRDQWVFRGCLPDWPHETGLERVCRAWRIPLADAADLERRLIREFKRHPEVPIHDVEGDTLACVALMQHHGAPTRLLDFTYSPYVAAYFALDALFEVSKNRDSRPPDAASVLAINVDWLNQQVERVLPALDWDLYRNDKKTPGVFDQLFLERKPPIAFLGTVTPLRLNQRLSVQQGVFLCPGDVSQSWARNLETAADPGAAANISMYLIDRDSLPAAFEALARMNVTARSLFPGIDGYSKNLAHRAKLLQELRLPRV
jgi:hypothetical protein